MREQLTTCHTRLLWRLVWCHFLINDVHRIKPKCNCEWGYCCVTGLKEIQGRVKAWISQKIKCLMLRKWIMHNKGAYTINLTTKKHYYLTLYSKWVTPFAWWSIGTGEILNTPKKSKHISIEIHLCLKSYSLLHIKNMSNFEML